MTERYRVRLYLIACALLLGVWLVSFVARAHDTAHPQFHELTHDEWGWVRMQKNHDGQWCCAPHNIQLLKGAEVRIREGRTEVYIRDVDQWVHVPERKRMVYAEGNPFGMEALVFFSTYPQEDGTFRVYIWCLSVGGGT